MVGSTDSTLYRACNILSILSYNSYYCRLEPKHFNFCRKFRKFIGQIFRYTVHCLVAIEEVFSSSVVPRCVRSLSDTFSYRITFFSSISFLFSVVRLMDTGSSVTHRCIEKVSWEAALCEDWKILSTNFTIFNYYHVICR